MLLQGTIDRETGQAQLQFIADFMFTAGFLYKAPPLKVSQALIAAVRQGRICSVLWEAQSWSRGQQRHIFGAFWGLYEQQSMIESCIHVFAQITLLSGCNATQAVCRVWSSVHCMAGMPWANDFHCSTAALPSHKCGAVAVTALDLHPDI